MSYLFFIITVSKMDHKDYACFCCFVLTHGNDRCLKTVDGLGMTIKDLTDYFKGDSCPDLVGKPKLFFIQVSLQSLGFS